MAFSTASGRDASLWSTRLRDRRGSYRREARASGVSVCEARANPCTHVSSPLADPGLEKTELSADFFDGVWLAVGNLLELGDRKPELVLDQLEGLEDGLTGVACVVRWESRPAVPDRFEELTCLVELARPVRQLATEQHQLTELTFVVCGRLEAARLAAGPALVV